jgi:stage III sporulation protein AA
MELELEVLISKLPPHVQEPLRQREDIDQLLEVVLDLGRFPEARFLDSNVFLNEQEVTQDEIQYTIERIGQFGEDNRAGIERTLHRISAIRNRAGTIIGLTLRVGRAVYGTIRVIEDLILTGKSVLLLGKPGVGKTTMLREVARVLADSANRRVIVVDTSNEIAGDGDIPHPAIGKSRRMQVASPLAQHGVMIEAVENHMPEVIVIDEIGTEQDANAARTIAERGVQLVATAHGNSLDNLIMNPTLSDLVGGVQAVTLGDIEARRRRTQKTVLERKAPPTFDILVEIQSWNRVVVHDDVSDTVDRILRGINVSPELRTLEESGAISKTRAVVKSVQVNGRSSQQTGRSTTDADAPDDRTEELEAEPVAITHIMPYGVNKGKLQQVVKITRAPVEVVDDINKADLLLTTKNYYRRKTQALQLAEQKGKPVYVLRRNTAPQIEQFIQAVTRRSGNSRNSPAIDVAVTEAEDSASRILNGEHEVELNPQGAYIRHLQHEIAEKHNLASSSTGKEPSRHVVFYHR